MKKLLVAVLLLVPSFAMANGKALHDAACLHCHASLMSGPANTIYSRADRKVGSLQDLQKRITACASAADAQWTAKQKSQVVNYLNKSFYLF